PPRLLFPPVDDEITMRHLRPLLLLILLSFTVPAGADEPLRAEDLEFFEKKIRPLLSRHCFECHAADAKTLHGSLRLDTAEGLAAGGDSGPVVVAGQPEESLLIDAVLYGADSLQMPPRGKLAEHEIAALTEWVRRGAPFPQTADPADPAGSTAKSAIDLEAG